MQDNRYVPQVGSEVAVRRRTYSDDSVHVYRVEKVTKRYIQLSNGTQWTILPRNTWRSEPELSGHKVGEKHPERAVETVHTDVEKQVQQSRDVRRQNTIRQRAWEVGKTLHTHHVALPLDKLHTAQGCADALAALEQGALAIRAHLDFIIGSRWFVQEWIISGEFTGYRVIRYMPDVQGCEVAEGFAAQNGAHATWEERSALYKQAEALCDQLNAQV